MLCQVDQSGKLEYLNKPTIVAISNDKHHTIFISSIEKKKLKRYFRQLGKPNMYLYTIFSKLLFLLIKEAGKNTDCVEVDREYWGKEHLIKNLLYQYIKANKKIKMPEVRFSLIGKNSPAHELALRTYRGEIKPNRKLLAKDLIKKE